MCGRFALEGVTYEQLAGIFALVAVDTGELRPRYNIAPTQAIPIVHHPTDAPGRLLESARWGLIPSWAKDPSIGGRLFNARSETAAEKPSFRAAFTRRRCLVPASGWYEWGRRPDGRRQPYYMTPADGSLLAFAGLWESWRDPALSDAPPLVTATILTGPSDGPLAPIHDRVPLVIEQEHWGAWLGEDGASKSEALTLLDELRSDEHTTRLASRLELRPVGASVGSVRNDSAALVERVAETR
jgi:putative SOS response-associated peptidase YedK